MSRAAGACTRLLDAPFVQLVALASQPMDSRTPGGCAGGGSAGITGRRGR
eukprot:CAMPEP_0197902784 /NCGR_PEP_ID=MMETSP1439-20131203/54294_1 /TAXON_ID=66791 /ORGANISM="Gonyaulax spinifera, Strain CCMP409" /LENGTH=49 /DNA_ID= /DNA_START= /DNA_END= /DNA_ORIENTATION=